MAADLSITLARDTPAERRASAAVNALAVLHDLDPFLYTRDIVIEEGGHPRSHPRLTLGTRHVDDADFLLAEFLHEQLHWYEEEEADLRDLAIADTVRIYAEVPVERPEGAGSEESTRLHLLVCTWEYWALWLLLGADRARAIIATLARDHYCWIYRKVLEDEPILKSFVVSHALVPAGLDRFVSPPADSEER